MQIGSVTNQYINNYHYEGVQQANQQSETREIETLSETQLQEYKQQQHRDTMRYIAYMMMMQFFAKNQMWNLLDQLRIQRTLDITA